MVRHTKDTVIFTWYDGGDWCGPCKIRCARGWGGQGKRGVQDPSFVN